MGLQIKNGGGRVKQFFPFCRRKDKSGKDVAAKADRGFIGGGEPERWARRDALGLGFAG